MIPSQLCPCDACCTKRTEDSHPRYSFPSSEAFHQQRKYSAGRADGCVCGATFESPKSVVPGVWIMGELNETNSMGYGFNAFIIGFNASRMTVEFCRNPCNTNILIGRM